MEIKLSELTLDDLEPYILGKEFTGEAKDMPRLNKDVFEKFLTMIEEDPIAKSFLDACEHYKDFYNMATDFKALIPKEYQMECFYAAKNGKFYVEIPSFCVYMLDRAYKMTDGIPNLILKYLPYPALTEMLKKDYFLGGMTLRDAICNVCCEEYNPVSKSKPKNKLRDFTELYIASTDMVAAVPHNIADKLDINNVLDIQMTDKGLASNGVLLRTMCDYVGAVNSKYDLRKLI